MSRDIDELLKMLGAGALFGLVMLFANKYQTLFLSLFWGAVLLGGAILWRESRKEKRGKL